MRDCEEVDDSRLYPGGDDFEGLCLCTEGCIHDRHCSAWMVVVVVHGVVAPEDQEP